MAFGRALCWLAVVAFASACGESSSDGDAPAGQAGKSSTAAGAGGGSAGTAGPTGSAGSSSAAGSGAAGSSSTAGGSAAGGASSGGGKPSGGAPATGGTTSSDAGAANGGASTDLVDCDPMKITCKRAAPPCPAGEVPSIDDVGNCYGDCVKIDRCACSTAQQCPDNNQYTCWAKQHCGPYVQ